MWIGSQVAWDDTVLPFQLEQSDVRGRVARLDGLLNTVLDQHDYPPAIEALVAEAVLLTALMGQMIDLRWKLSLQIRGDGPARLIATDYYSPPEPGEPGMIRAYASFDEERLEEGADPFGQIGQGFFAVIIDQGEGTDPYQGITPLDGGSLVSCAQTYFMQSEQLPTRFALAFGKTKIPGSEERWRAGGIMLQHLPDASPLMKGPEPVQPKIVNEDDHENWNRANILLDTVDELELVGPAVQPTDLLVRLFHEEDARVYDAQQVKFGCTCSEDRVRHSLSMYSAKDIGHMTTDEGTVTADCQFCGAHYILDPKTVGFEPENDV